MPARSLNKVLLIGNLTRDPELRYTPQGSAVCNFGLATNRYWTNDAGERQEETVFHRIVAWSKLAEICSQLLGKGDKVFVEGRLVTRQWEGQDGVSRTTTEVVIADMILLKSQRGWDERDQAEGEVNRPKVADDSAKPSGDEGGDQPTPTPQKTGSKATKKAKKKQEEMSDEEIASDDIPF